MRLAVKNTILALAIWTACLAALWVWIEKDFSSAMTEASDDTALLLSRQIALVLREPLMDALLRGEGRQALAELLANAAERSLVLTSVDVMNADGRIVASDDTRLVGTTTRGARDLFGDDPIARLAPEHRIAGLGPRRISRIHVPLLRQGDLAGYLTVGVQHRRLTDLYDQFYGRLTLGALVALLMVVALGALLQIQLNRTGGRLAKVVASYSNSSAPSDLPIESEFADVREAAAQVGAELHAARGDAQSARNELNTLSRLTKFGVMLLDARGAPTYVADVVSELFAEHDAAKFEAVMDELTPHIEAAVNELKERPALPVTRDIRLSSAEDQTFHLEFHALDTQRWRGCLVLIKNRELIEALDADLRAATRWRGLSALYVGAAHDIRSPLNALSMNLELLKRGLDRAPPVGDSSSNREQLSRYAQVVQDELGRLHRRLEALIRQAAPHDDSRPHCDVTTVLETLEQLLYAQGRAQRVNIEMDSPATAVNVQLPEAHVHQILLNLLVNALEAMPDGGKLAVDVAHDEQSAIITVQDSGPGIPGAMTGKVFEMHFTTKSTGTGVGLYVVRDLVNRHGGTIAVESELGEGARFRVVLPLHHPD